MKNAEHFARDQVLAVYPTTTGFGWAIFEGSLSPVDWGVSTIKTRKGSDESKNARGLARFKKLLDQFQPSVVVLEQFEGSGARRADRIQLLCKSFVELARTRGIDVAVYSRSDIASVFEPLGAKTRYEIATAIAVHIDAFEHLLPPARQIWLAEHPRMGLFNAAAVAITQFSITAQRQSQHRR